MSAAEADAWRAARRLERRERRRGEARAKRAAASPQHQAAAASESQGDGHGEATSTTTTATTTASLLARDREWVVCAATFDALAARVRVGGAVIVLTDDEAVRVWLQQQFAARAHRAAGAELRAAIREFHVRTGLSADFVGQTAREAGYDAGGGGGGGVSEAGGGDDGGPRWTHVATLTVHSLLKLRGGGGGDTTAGLASGKHATRSSSSSSSSSLERALREFDTAQAAHVRRSQLAGQADENDDDADATDADAGEFDEAADDAEGVRLRRHGGGGSAATAAAASAEQRDARLVVARVPPPTAHALCALADARAVAEFAVHAHRQHTKCIVLQRV